MVYFVCPWKFQERQCLNMTSIANTVNARRGYIFNGIRLLQFCFFTTSSFYSTVPNCFVCVTALCVFAFLEWLRPLFGVVKAPKKSRPGGDCTALPTGFLPITKCCYGVSLCPLHHRAPLPQFTLRWNSAVPQNIQNSCASATCLYWKLGKMRVIGKFRL